ncbi:hypothetical protein QBC38DRAFT_455664 [Podospora fimiseda]|uniref:Uncharacterized protein n=1 Tax=Podospora fimiseda TaxID=252190 RepID=A0AAN7H3Z9_9PEZI|nr:hypothetical protein QBC38DRAFT_455664 [Podospora fimiseda]
MRFLMGEFVRAAEQLRSVISVAEKVIDWPRENTVRARYYLSHALKGVLGDTDDEGNEIEASAKTELELFLRMDDTGMGTRYAGKYPMLFDYLVDWEHRLVTPRKPQPMPVP